MSKLHQIISVIKTRKADAEKALTQAYHKFQADNNILIGISKTYVPITESTESEYMPNEKKPVRTTVKEILRDVREICVAAHDLVYLQDSANCEAKANVDCSMHNRTLALKDIPATHLLYMEKQIQSYITVIEKMPVVDSSEKYVFDSQTNLYATEPIFSVRTKKIKKGLILAPATEKHPAQSQMIEEDVQTHKISTVKYSGAVTEETRQDMLARAKHLLAQVQSARAVANEVEVSNNTKNIGGSVFDFIFN